MLAAFLKLGSTILLLPRAGCLLLIIRYTYFGYELTD